MPPDPPDIDLFARVQLGDVAAFEAIFRRYHQPLCEFVATYLGALTASEDVVQDLFTALWMDASKWRIHSTLRAYLFAAARNRALKQLRRDRRIVDLGDEPSDIPAAAADTTALDVELETGQAIERLGRAIASLPPRTRLAVSLRWGQEMSHAEIAEAMDISLKGVEKLLATGLSKLRESMR
jgi:RNA polymerase sigma-70 factor (ECF subfamily)